MPVNGPIPEPVLAIVAAATVFAIMFTLGLGIVLGEFRWVFARLALVAKGLFSVLVAVPALALVVGHGSADPTRTRERRSRSPALRAIPV